MTVSADELRRFTSAVELQLGIRVADRAAAMTEILARRADRFATVGAYIACLEAADRDELRAPCVAQRGRARLEVEAQERLGVAGAHVEPPPRRVAEVAELDRDAVEVVDLALLVDVGQLADLPVLVLDLEVDLPGLAVPLQGLDQAAQRLLLRAQHGQQPGERDGGGVGVVVVLEVDVA